MIDNSTTLSIALQLTLAQWKDIGLALRETAKQTKPRDPVRAARMMEALEHVAEKTFAATSLGVVLDP